KGLGQPMIAPGNGNAPFLHRLEQGGLGPRARSIDFVRHQKLAKYRPLDETECAPPAFGLFQHFRAQDIGRHEVRRALDSLRVEPEHDAERFDEAGLRKPRHPDEEGVPAREERDNRMIYNGFLSENNLADPLANETHPLAKALDLGHERTTWLAHGRTGLDDCHVPCSLLCAQWYDPTRV